MVRADTGFKLLQTPVYEVVAGWVSDMVRCAYQVEYDARNNSANAGELYDVSYVDIATQDEEIEFLVKDVEDWLNNPGEVHSPVLENMLDYLALRQIIPPGTYIISY